MQTETPKLGQVSYNAAQEAFEALATISTVNGDMRYPVQYPAPLNISDDLVHHGLMARAALAHQQGNDLRSMICATSKDATHRLDVVSTTPFEKARDFFGLVWNKAA
ncbi:hypothetical protein [Roseivivax sp. CAU 1753]